MLSNKVRSNLVRDIVIVIILIAGTILAFTYLQGAKLRQEISHTYINRTIDEAAREFERYFQPIQRSLLVAQKWGKIGKLDVNDGASLNSDFFPILEELTDVDSMSIANTIGAEYFIKRDGKNWLTRTIKAHRQDKRVLWQSWNNDGKLIKQWEENLDYNPQERPWFKGVMSVEDNSQMFWTKPYIFYTAQTPGITAAMRWQNESDKPVQTIVAFDVLLSNIFEVITSTQTTKNGKSFLFNQQGKVFLPGFNSAQTITHSNGKALKHKNIESKDNANSGVEAEVFYAPHKMQDAAILTNAIKAWSQQIDKHHEPMELKIDKQVWWVGYHPLNTQHWKLWIGVAIPQQDFLGELNNQRQFIIWISVAIVGLGIVIIIIIFNKYNKQTAETTKLDIDKNNLVQSVRTLLANGESSSVEFKSTMRMNLKSGKSGKEIELAWLKGVVAYLNTEGGTILIGVNDNGEILGLDADQFENDDKCRLHFKNLISQHIGLEFSKLLYFEIVELDGKKLIVIDCEVSKDPAFLHNKNEETFYIRSGPASVQLSTSKVLKYLKHRV